jgi:diacylglycerol kinase (ATP)
MNHDGRATGTDPGPSEPVDGRGGSLGNSRRGTGVGQGPAEAVFGGGGAAVRVCPWVGIVANPGAGVGRGRARVARLVHELRRRNIHPRIAWTPDERTRLVAEAAADPRARCLVAVGGDGTVAALVNESPRTPIVVLPSGTENLFAHHFRFSRCPSRLAATIDLGRVATIDLGSARGRRFALMAGFGFDADVVTRHHIARVGHSGVPRPTNRAAYVEPVLRSSFGYRFPPMTVTVAREDAAETLVGSTVFVFNLPTYALGLPFAPSARADDGLLDLIVFHKPGAFHALRYLWLVVCGLHLGQPGVEHRRVSRVTITAPESVPVQLDGDPGGFLVPEPDGGWTVEVIPDTLDVMVPSSFRAEPVRVASEAGGR